MLKPIVIETNLSLIKIRLQSPTLIGKGKCKIELLCRDEGWRIVSDKISVTVRIEKKDDSEIRLHSTLVNDGDTCEIGFIYPYLFYRFNQDNPVRVFEPTYGGTLEPRNIFFKVSYPGPASFCLTGATSPGIALAMGIFNHEQRRIDVVHVPVQQWGLMRFHIDRIQIRSNKSLELPVSFIKCSEHWGDAFLPYRKWLTSTFRRQLKSPDWFLNEGFTETRKAHCVSPCYPYVAPQGMWLFDNESRPRLIGELKAEVDEAFNEYSKRGLKPLFYQFGWWKNMATMKGLFMFDSFVGDYTESHELTPEIIDYIHRKGGRVYLYINAISVGSESIAFQENSSILIRDKSGHPSYNASYPMYMLCPGASGIHEFWDKSLYYILKELDADGVFLDQACGGFPPQYCYAPEHHHAHPDTYGADYIKMMDYIGRRVREIKSDAVVIGELCHDVRSLYLAETHGRGYVKPENRIPQSDEEKKNTEPTEYYAFLKYMSPEVRSQTVSMDIVMDGSPGHMDQKVYRENREVFDAGFVPCKAEYPGIVAYLYGHPESSKAILAVRCHANIKGAKVFLPRPLKPVKEGDRDAIFMDEKTVAVDVGPAPNYYSLVI